MDEHLRRYYLTTLGIEPWCARWPLPGAAPSPRSPAEPVAPMDAGDNQALESPSKSSPQVKKRNQGTSLDAVRQALGPQASAQRAQPQVEPATDADPAPETEVESDTAQPSLTPLNAMVWHSERFSLLAAITGQLPHDARNRLGRNILRALGAGVEADAVVVRWPPFDNPELPGNNFGAFNQVVERLVRPSISQHWILLGAGRNSTLAGAIGSQGQAVALSTAYSIEDLLSEPSYKRTLWEQLKPILARSQV
ncbi:hypothetical protein [Salicola sp. Rm-C-2C1-2]|uniref:hypothetical protein n=1 Tax=Salicola sp. Rm-C-2C1-2 TaxID=3141321 RepID=UPI0032E40F26